MQRLAVAEHGEGHPRGVEQLGHRAGRLLRAVLVARRRSRPRTATRRRTPSRRPGRATLTGNGRSLAQSSRARAPMPHGLPLLSRFLNRPPSSARERRLDERLVAPHVDDVVDVLDVDRALLDARAAGRARPQHVLVDDGIRAVRVVCRQRQSASRSRCRRRAVSADHETRPLDRVVQPCVLRSSRRDRRQRLLGVAVVGGEGRRYGALASAWSRSAMMSSLGDSGLSVFHAGHCDWQRPHSVHVEKSSRPFQVKSSTAPTPSASPSSRSSIGSMSNGLPPT